MKRLATLVHAGLRSNFGLSLLRYRLFKERRDLWLVPVLALGLAGIVPLLYGYLSLIRSMYGILRQMGQEQALPGLAILVSQLLVLFFGLYYVISAFYFSRDLEMLVPLPLKPFEVVFSKFAIILVNEYLTLIPILLPMLVYFGLLSRSSPAYWVQSLIVYLLLPVIPLCLVSVLTVVLMRLVSFSRKKDALILVGSLVAIFLAFGLQLLLAKSSAGQANPEELARFLGAPDSLLNQVGAKFPPSIWAAKALAGGFSAPGLLNLGLLAGVSLVLFAGILVLAERLFYRGLIGLEETSGRKRSLTARQMARRVSSGRRPVRAVFQREWRIMNRTPIFLLNGVLTALILPFIFALMSRMDTSRGDLADFVRLIGSGGPSAVVILAAAAFLMVCGCLNGTSSSTFSREGRQFWLSKVIPVPPRQQAAAKFLHSYLVALVGMGAALVVLLVFLKLRVPTAAAALGLALVGAVALTAMGMIIDLARPMLDWTNPHKAIRQNLNVLFALVADAGLLAVIGYGLYRLGLAGVGGSALLIVALAVLTALSWVGYHFLGSFAERRYPQIEV